MKTKLLQQTPGPSTYVDDEYYQRLYGIAKEWSNPGQPVSPELYYEITALLNRECRLLDDGRFEEWLDLFQEQCVYWIPQWCNAAESGTNDHLGDTGPAAPGGQDRPVSHGLCFFAVTAHPYPPLP